MTPGTNTFTLIVQNWNGLSMSYGMGNGGAIPNGVFQTPYIVQKIPEEGLGLPNGDVVVTKKISPVSLKQNTYTMITVSVVNQGTKPVHDIEIVDSAPQEFPVVDGSTQLSAPSLEPNDSINLTYIVQATEPGSFSFNETSVMYADQDGNYHLINSGPENVEVFAPLIATSNQNDIIQEILSWLKGL